MLFGLGAKEILILNGLIFLLFGSKKIPELTKIIVDGIVRLRHGPSDGKKDIPNKTDTIDGKKDIPNKTDTTP